MYVEDKTLYLDQKIEFEDNTQLLELEKDVDTISIQTNDIHPAIWQILFLLSENKNIIVEDDFNKRFFDNLRLIK